jgi:hypothetical protein
VTRRLVVLLLCALGGVGCSKQPELVPAPQRFALGCPDLQSGWPPDSAAPLVVLGGLADLRFRGDTVGWAWPERREYEEGEEGFWASLINGVWQDVMESLRDPIPLVAVPDARSVLRWDLAEVLRRAGFRVLDAAGADRVPPGLPRLEGDLGHLEAFYSPRRARRGDSLVTRVAIELSIRGESPIPRWRRRVEAEAEWRQDHRPDRADFEGLVGQAWCDLLGQVEEAFRGRDFSAAVAGEQ